VLWSSFLLYLTTDVRTFPPGDGRFLVTAERVRLGCGHSSMRRGPREVVKRSSVGSILPRQKDGIVDCFPASAVQRAAHPEHAAII
jgi:hypothetical protein